MLGSFRHKLAVYFLLLAVAPLTAVFWGFGTVTKRAEERRADARLEAELRAVFASYERQANRVESLARKLAGRRDVQRSLRLGSFGRLPRDVAVLGRHRLAIGRRGTIESTQTVRVKAGERVIGSILAVLPLDRSLLRRLHSESGLASGDRIVFVPRSKPDRPAPQPVASGRPLTVSVAGTRSRALATTPLGE